MPISDTLTSIIVPFVRTPSWVNRGLFGFFLTEIIGSWTVTLSSGCVTWAFLYLKPIGRMKRSYFTGLRVKSEPTNVGFVIILFQPFFFVFCPVFTTEKASSSEIPRTFGNGTENLAAFSLLRFLIAVDRAFAFVASDLSNRYWGTGVDEGSDLVEPLTFRCSCALIVFRS